jgi:replicative DNA helicase
MEECGCHAPGTEVIMYDGHLKKVEDIQIGDLLMGDDGTPRKVLELHHGTD